MDDVAWGALTLSLTLLGAIYTWVVFQRRGTAAAVRGAGLTLLPVALLLTHTLRMVTRIADAIGDWATALVFSPQVWVGVVLGGLGVTLFVLGGVLRDRQVAGQVESGGTRERHVEGGGAARGLPAARATGRKPAATSEDAEIEALLRKHGIS